MLVTGVPVQYQLAGETRGDFVRLIEALGFQPVQPLNPCAEGALGL